MSHRHACLAAALTLLHATSAPAGELDPGPQHLWAGIGPNCTHDDIQDAIDDASPTRGAIIHVVGAQWRGIGLVVQGKDITLQGGHVACLDNTLSGRTVLHNTPYRGTQGSPVLGVYGAANVTASRLEFVDGGQDNPAQDGGGIVFEGTGTLTLGNVAVRDNIAANGGGIAVKASGGPAQLWLLADTRIADNMASGSGGGIHLSGGATLRAHAPEITIVGNVAQGDGGGIAITEGGHALLASSNRNGRALIEDNVASRGGGIVVYGEDGTRASSLRLFSIDARRPTVVRGNAAQFDGGAIHAGAATLDDAAQGVQVCVSDTRFELNRAQDGAVVSASRPFEARGGGAGMLHPPTVRLGVPHDATDCPGPLATAHGAVACLQGVGCNRYANNAAIEDDAALRGGGEPQFPGSVFSVRRGGLLLVDRIVLQDNLALGALLGVQGGTLRMVDSVVSGNTALFGPVVSVDADGGAGFIQSTVVDNGTPTVVVDNEGAFGIFDSIVDAGDRPLWRNIGDGLADVARSLVSNVEGVPADALFGHVVGRARFVDRAGDNLRLAGDSLAIDAAPANDGIDLDGTPRSHDAPRTNRSGPRDLGAFEWTPDFVPGRLFADGLEDTP